MTRRMLATGAGSLWWMACISRCWSPRRRTPSPRQNLLQSRVHDRTLPFRGGNAVLTTPRVVLFPSDREAPLACIAVVIAGFSVEPAGPRNQRASASISDSGWAERTSRPQRVDVLAIRLTANLTATALNTGGCARTK